MNKHATPITLRLLASFIDILLILALCTIIFFCLSVIEASLTLSLCVMLFVLIFYPLFFELLPMSATPGMYFVGLYVTVRRDEGHGIAIFKRFFFRLILCIPLGIGFWYGFFSKDGKTLYDTQSHTIVERHVRNRRIRPCIAISYDGTSKRNIFFLNNGRHFIGRDPGCCDVLFPDGEVGVSRCHCSITYNPQTQMFLLEDMGSSGGTYLSNGTSLVIGQVTYLSPGESFYLTAKKYLCTVGFSK